MANLSINKSFALKILQYVIIFLLLYQVFHVLDHALQYYQFYVLGIFPPPALFEGLLNASDNKVHLWLNIIEFAAIILIAVCFYLTNAYTKRIHRIVSNRSSATSATKILQYTIIFLVVYQSLHVLDHVFQFYELYLLGISPPPALFEGLFNESDTKIHLWINGILFVASVTIFIAFILYKKDYKISLSSIEK
ncbi:MAG TPA: hypothetical protein VF884_02990 [Nitrososphaeraceae archaeon]